MNNVRRLFIGFTAVLATVVGASAAHADRQMLVLIDASGSMSTVRADSTTRFDAAKQRALDQIAVQASSGLDLFTVGGGNTPLAGSMCAAIDTLAATGATTKILEVASDGEENFTPPADPCFGPFSTDPNPPYSAGSWENLVYNKVAGAGI